MTGSCTLVEVGDKRFLVDCGMFQGGHFNEVKNAEPFPFDPASLDAVFVTHAHLDHIGRLPLLVKQGFRGTIYATAPTIDLLELILEDAHAVMEYDHRKLGHPVLYEREDIAQVRGACRKVEYGTPVVIPAPDLSSPRKRGSRRGQAAVGISLLDSRLRGNDIKVVFHDVGHILGSAFIEIRANGKRVVFSGDIGNANAPIVRDTEPLPPELDALVCESTYGNRIHESGSLRQEIIEREVLAALRRGGVLMIPSFSLERTQELIYELNNLIDREHRLPVVPIFLDSPLAIGALKVYRQYHQYYDEEATRLFQGGDDLFQFPGLQLTATTEESKRINQVPAPKIIIAGAGMMNGGRIVHHALRYLSDPKSTLLIIGYQAAGTLGREILEGNSPVTVMGERVPVRCRVRAIGALSAHADQEKLLDWIGGGLATPKKVYLNHGEPPASEALAKRLTAELGIKATVVNHGLKVEV